MLRGLIAAAAAMLVFTPAAVAGGPSILVGAVEDAPKSLDASTAKAKLDLARLAGFDSVRITQIWTPGATTPGGTELTALQNVANAASLNGMRTIVAIYHRNGTATPADATARGQLAQYAAATAKALPSVKDFVIGNEPNSNTFWMPQFAADGSDAAAQAYLDLLARSYDAVKAVRPDARLIGGALAPRGEDSPASSRPTHSPVTFIADLGKAYRASGRSAPLMDVFDMHVYEDYSALPPSFDHLAGNTVAVPDYTKLVTSLGQAFDGTAQAGSTLPILYGEFGVESIIPAAKAGVYTGTEPAATKPVDEATQAAYYREAMKIAVCKPNVVGLMLFHVSDEANLAAWQSGPYYADDTAKSSLTGIRDAANALHAGTLTSCPDATAPAATLTGPAPGSTVRGSVTLAATASDDVGVNRVEFLVNGAVVGYKGVPPYTFTWSSGASGTYTIAARALDAVRNAGTTPAITITVDNTPPETAITAPAAGTTTDSPTFQLAASEPGATFECSLDAGAFASCPSTQPYTALAAGSHTFSARATDAVGNVDPTPATFTWTAVDTTPPDTSITSGPVGTTTSHSASFGFTGTEPGGFQCSLEGGAWSACSSPATSSVPDGVHSFAVRAVDAAGNADPTPATRGWTVVTRPANDAFAAAAGIGGTTGTWTGSTLNATKEPGEPRHAANAGGASIWFRWTAPSSGRYYFSTSGSGFNTLLAVYRGTSVSALSVVAANDDNGTSHSSALSFWGSSGVTYRIAIDGYGAAAGNAKLSWHR